MIADTSSNPIPERRNPNRPRFRPHALPPSQSFGCFLYPHNAHLLLIFDPSSGSPKRERAAFWKVVLPRTFSQDRELRALLFFDPQGGKTHVSLWYHACEASGQLCQDEPASESRPYIGQMFLENTSSEITTHPPCPSLMLPLADHGLCEHGALDPRGGKRHLSLSLTAHTPCSSLILDERGIEFKLSSTEIH